MLKLDIQMFADGKIVISTELDTNNFENGLNKIQSTTNKAGLSMKGLIAGLGISKVISKGFELINSSLDGSISRLDTINNFPKVMSNLGIASEDADKSIKKMSDRLSGLPTTLDQGAIAVQRFTSKNNDVRKSTDIFLALNNAILAGGASSEIQASALEQLSQSYAKGKPDMMEWRTAMTAMPAQLKQVAEAMGYIDADALGEDLRKGNVSMDEFMDTIIRLNTEGINGFANFETQARNSTGGIATSITVAKTQIVKGVADIIAKLDEGLQKAGFDGISGVIASAGKEAKKQLDNVANLLSKIDFKKLVNDLKSMLPLIKAIGVAWASWKIGKGLNEFSGKISLARKGLALFSETMAKSGNSSSLLNNVIGKSQVLIKSFGSSAGGAAKASGILSSALGSTSSIMAVLPWAGAVAGAVALGYGIYKAATYVDDYTKKTREQIKANEEMAESQQKANKQMQEKITSSSSEMQYYKNLQIELQSIVDENGKIKSGYEDRAKVITGILKDALGVEGNIVNGVIQNYKEYNNEIDKTIAKKKAKVILDAQEEQYTEAIKNQLKYQKQMSETQQEIEKWTRKINDIKEKMKNTDVVNDRDEMLRLGNELTTYKGYLDEKTKQYNSAKKITEEYTNDIIVYEGNLKNFQSGNYEAMIQDIDGYVAKLSSSNEEKRKILENDILTEQTTLDNLKELKKKTHSEIYDEQIKAHEQTLQQYQTQLNDLNSQIEAERQTWLIGTQKTISDLSGQQVQFSDLGNGFVMAYVNGIQVGKPIAYQNLESFGNEITQSLNKNTDVSSDEAKKLVEKYANKFSSDDSKKKAKGSANKIGDTQLNALKEKEKAFVGAGQDTAQGVVRGATSKKSLNELHNAGIRMGNAVEDGYRSATKTHSPSRLFAELAEYIPAGIAVGIDKNKGVAISSIKDMASSMYGEMERAVNFETNKMNLNVETGKVFNTLASTTPVYVQVNADVEMDKTKVGRIVTPVVSETLKTGGLR